MKFDLKFAIITLMMLNEKFNKLIDEFVHLECCQMSHQITSKRCPKKIRKQTIVYNDCNIHSIRKQSIKHNDLNRTVIQVLEHLVRRLRHVNRSIEIVITMQCQTEAINKQERKQPKDGQ